MQTTHVSFNAAPFSDYRSLSLPSQETKLQDWLAANCRAAPGFSASANDAALPGSCNGWQAAGLPAVGSGSSWQRFGHQHAPLLLVKSLAISPALHQMPACIQLKNLKRPLEAIQSGLEALPYHSQSEQQCILYVGQLLACQSRIGRLPMLSSK